MLDHVDLRSIDDQLKKDFTEVDDREKIDDQIVNSIKTDHPQYLPVFFHIQE